jgi:hypothetical protein
MDGISISFIASDAFSEFLERPFSGWMSGDVEMKDAPGGNFDDNEHVEKLKRGRDHDEEVAGDNRFGMIPLECHPSLLRIWRTRRPLRHMPSNGTRRNLDTDFEQQFIGDAFLTPCRITDSHFGDQFSYIGRQTRPASRAGSPFPKQTKALTMPTNQRVGFDDDQRARPIEPS